MPIPSPTSELADFVQEEQDGYDVIVVYAKDTGEQIAVIPIGQVINRGSSDPLKYNYSGALEQARQQWELYLQLQEESLTKDAPLGQFGPAWVLTDEEWAFYLQTIGEGVSDITGKARSKYMATIQETEAAWNMFNPDISLGDFLGQKWEGGQIPSWFSEQWGISATPPPVPEAPTIPQWTGPPTPGFLTELTGLERGQPLEARPTKFASGQLLQRLTPSQLQGIGGYVNWAAGQVSGAPASFEDWLAGSQALLPRSVPRGTVRWSPSPYRV